MPAQIRYRDYLLERNPKPIPLRGDDWDWWHVDYDGPGDKRCGTAGSAEACRRDIDEQIADAEAP